MSDPLVGTTLDGRYRVLRILGEGGMGIVYEAHHELIDRKVAIKVLREDFSRRADVVERFRREAKSASRIGHPNIVDVLDFGQTPEGASYFVMELLQGEDLADLLARDVRLSPPRAVAIAVQCCRALAAAHEKGIVHRDLKPENVFIIERGGFPDFVKLVDFGVAKMSELDAVDGGGRKLTRTGMIFGTPEYMSPEQANGQTLDHRVDIYALGIILYEALTGRVPFEGETFMAVLSKHAAAPVPPLREAWPGLSVSPELEAVVMRALTKQRDNRFAHMRAFGEALEAVPEMPETVPRDSYVAVPRASAPSSPGRESAPPPAMPDSSLSPLPDMPVGWPRSERWSRALPVLVALLVIGSGTASLLLARNAETIEVTSLPETPSTPLATATAPQVAPEAPSLEAKPAAVAEAAAAPAAAAPELVTLHVTTRPTGAMLRLASGGELCGRTPCSFEVVRGAQVSLLARHGRQRATTTLTPQATADVHLVLDAPSPTKGERLASPAARAPGSTAAKGERQAGEADEVAADDDFKTPEVFK
jgi:serine/threonine-protein kinase